MGGLTPLHAAAGGGFDDIVQLLLAQGADPHTASAEGGLTPLYWAALGGCGKIVQQLLAREAAVDAVDRLGMTALLWAAVGGHQEIVLQLLVAGAVAGHKVPEGVSLGQQVVLVNGALVQFVPKAGTTALHLAAGLGHAQVVIQLLEAGVRVDAEDSQLCTALHYAAGTGHTKVVQQLLAKGAKAAAGDASGTTALHESALRGCVEIVELLLAAGGSPAVLDGMKHNVLHVAAAGGSEEVVRLVLAAGCSSIVNSRDSSGSTPLYYAAVGGCDKVVELLLAAGAGVDEVGDSMGVGATCMAWYGTAGPISANGASAPAVVVAPSGGWTILHAAASSGSREVVQMLVDAGAAVGAVDSKGGTALHVAAGVPVWRRSSSAAAVQQQCSCWWRRGLMWMLLMSTGALPCTVQQLRVLATSSRCCWGPGLR